MSPAANESLPGVPSKFEQRLEATENTGAADTTPPDERRASSIRDHHTREIARLDKEIAAHQEIIREQNEILGEVREGEIDTSSEPLLPDTDIASRFHNAFDAIYTVDELKEDLHEYGLSTSGNKPELIERLVAYHNGELDEEDEEDEGGNPDSDSNSDPNLTPLTEE